MKRNRSKHWCFVRLGPRIHSMEHRSKKMIFYDDILRDTWPTGMKRIAYLGDVALVVSSKTLEKVKKKLLEEIVEQVWDWLEEADYLEKDGRFFWLRTKENEIGRVTIRGMTTDLRSVLNT